jgi:DNA-binding MarR family transcriptional regulator
MRFVPSAQHEDLEMTDAVVSAVLQLLATAAALHTELDALYARFGLTSSGFNVLRILQAEPGGRPRGEIAQGLVHRAPDVTRLIDRLERRGLVKRVRSRTDRRLSVTQITSKGAELVAHIEPLMEEYRRKMVRRLSPAEWKELSRLCERIVASEE